ncbi:MAG: right-handed parallel beta-helix repeat-containing protein, partial [Planctomycetota bacterium]
AQEWTGDRKQPMMRNEHIVRAHQAPVVATNPNNLDSAGNPLPWQIIHVDNSAAAGGNGTAEAPFRTLLAAENAALAAYDVVYVHVGASYTNPYITPATGYSFGNVNQYLIGEGSTLQIPTVSCGNRSLVATTQQNLYPQISNPIGPAINVDQPGATVSHLQIKNSNVGMTDGVGFGAPGVATISDVIISGSGGPFQRGVLIAGSEGRFNFDNVRLSNLGNDGFVVAAADGDVAITNSSLTDVAGTGILASGQDSTVSVTGTTLTRTTGRALAATGTGATINASNTKINTTQGAPADGAVASGSGSRITLADSLMSNVAGSALVASGAGSAITVNRSVMDTIGGSGIVASGTKAVVTATASKISATGNPGVSLTGDEAAVTLDATRIDDVTGVGVVVNATKAVFEMDNRSSLTNVTGNGIELLAPDALVYVLGNSNIGTVGGDGILSQGASLLVKESTIQSAGGAGIRAVDVNGTKVVAVQGGTLSDMVDGGILVSNSNLRVERADPADPGSRVTSITNAGVFGVSATSNTMVNSRVLVNNANITGVLTGITIRVDADTVPPLTVPQIQFNAQNNRISTSTDGTGIALSAVFDPAALTPLSRVNAAIFNNAISVGGNGEGILLTTVGGPTQFPDPVTGDPIPVPAADRPIRVAAGGPVNLENLNNGTNVAEVPPEALPDVFSSVNYNPATFPPLPPQAPPPPP